MANVAVFTSVEFWST